MFLGLNRKRLGELHQLKGDHFELMPTWRSLLRADLAPDPQRRFLRQMGRTRELFLAHHRLDNDSL
jgi:hypothetical protein